MIAKSSEERGDFMLFAKKIQNTNKGRGNNVYRNNNIIKLLKD